MISGPKNEKQEAVVSAFRHAWKGYSEYAWGHDHLKPVSRTYNDWFTLKLTMIDSLDTIYIMGLNEGNISLLLLPSDDSFTALGFYCFICITERVIVQGGTLVPL